MIQKLLIPDPDRTPISWWSSIPAWQGRTEFEFGPGLTVLWGPNGSGKSSLLTLLAKLLTADQGGESMLTSSTLRNYGEPQKPPYTADVVSDGSAVRYISPSEKVGLVGGSFDYDFFDEGLNETMFKGSGGQGTIRKLNRVFNRPPWDRKIPDKVGKSVNDLWMPLRERFLAVTAAKIAEGPRTLLLDEGDLHLDIPMQRQLWDMLERASRAGKMQIIAASHGVFALNRDVAYIDVKPGYLEECRAALSSWSDHA